ncbi:MAG TPA: tRNA pseudouridine(13) synthase TruD [Gammaproteobacteria bacterium]
MYSFDSLARAHGSSLINGIVKSRHEDFRVDEIMPVEPSGEGEHLWLKIEKKGSNTEWVARQLAKLAGVKSMAVSYAGLKDRHGITTQWFSIHLPGQADPDLTVLPEDVHILQAIRHNRKLKRGTLSGNHFSLCIRDISGPLDLLEQRLQSIAEQGIPNYFGEQRFGHDMGNLDQAEKLFQGELKRLDRHERGLYLSAARSWIFNLVLSERIRQNNWNSYLSGDVFMLDGRSACFADDHSDDLLERIQHMQIHPTGPLWGKGESMAKKDCLDLEMTIASSCKLFCEGIAAAGMDQERRALRLAVKQMHWQFNNDQLLLDFELSAGSFATMVLREIIA